jgi:hypothetical protein
MKKIKVNEASEAVLNWLIAKCEGYLVNENSWMLNATIKDIDEGYYKPSEYWGQGGPIIELEGITVNKEDELWSAYFRNRLFNDDGSDHWSIGASPLIAAMRCYVCRKLGTEVEIPYEFQ